MMAARFSPVLRPPSKSKRRRRTIGPEEENGVLDSSFRVHRTKSLRVVDASVFPKIPGFFIASSIYMIGEKAADTILAQNP
jgi:choline dehydrogenase-like flavoprotein